MDYSLINQNLYGNLQVVLPDSIIQRRLNFVKQLNVSHNTRDIDFLLKWFDKVYNFQQAIVSSGVSLEQAKEDFKNQYFQMTPILDALYGENWDIHLNIENQAIPEFQLSYSLVLHYPSLTISNSNGSSHEIKNLFVTMPIFMSEDYEGGTVVYYLHFKYEGFRTSVTFSEYKSNYCHSHLNRPSYSDSSRYWFRDKDFCLGSNPIFEEFSYLSTHFTTDGFEFLLLNLKTTLMWESLQGTPYRYLENITNNEKRYLSPGLATLSSIKTRLRKDLEVYVDSDIAFSNGRFKIRKNDRFINWLTKLIKINPLIEDSLCFYISRPNDRVKYSIQANSSMQSQIESAKQGFENHKHLSFTFRNREFSMKLIKEQKVEQSGKTMTILDSTIINYIQKYLENELHTVNIKQQAFETCNTGEHI